MIDSVAFQTRARTIDHLGREQIADCPTAVSELWKNSYDAYARMVGLHIYDGQYPVATIVDNGHGMNAYEFTSKWLVVGTESKASGEETPLEDMCGLSYRVKQGQKGIGRLSCANLGSLLLVVSKRKNERYVASLIDWRIFENPYLLLTDVQIPVVEFDLKEELFTNLPAMFEKLVENIVPSSLESDRSKRIDLAWRQFSEQEVAAKKKTTTRQAITDTVIGTLFDQWHFSEWPLWKGESEHGTILAISAIQSDLIAQLPKYDSGGHGNDSTIVQAREQLFQTLANLADPFLSEEEKNAGKGVEQFSTKATARDRDRLKVIIDDEPPFDLAWLHELEHVVDGEFDADGVFRGRIKAFGTWLDEDALILPALDIPSRKDSIVGPFSIKFGTYEQRLEYTSHSEEVYRALEAKSENYAGLLIYRNGLRVMPYGREGTDFFQIEKRRTKHAGREFWSLRRIFGRVALGKDQNPNLRDKAGREGIIDNKAAKVFRDLIINVLMTLARNYFGTKSDLRQEAIPNRVAEYEQRKIEENRSKQRAQIRKQFSIKLRSNFPLLQEALLAAEKISEDLSESSLQDEVELIEYRGRVHSLRNNLKELSLSIIPKNLGLLEEDWLNYRATARRAREILDLLESKLVFSLESIKPKTSRELAYSELSSNAAFLHRRIRGWTSEAKKIINSEQARLDALQEERNKSYHAKTLPLLDSLESGELSLADVSRHLEEERDIQDAENSSLFESYVAALNSLSENIDLAGLLSHSDEVAETLKEEVDRLHALAQLGITVEIIGHEIESLEQSVSRNLKLLPVEVQSLREYVEVVESHEALIERLRFLSPLKLSGAKTRTKISGEMIYNYVLRFFKGRLDFHGVTLGASSGFLNFYVYDQVSRIYPVFINLINNSLYWVEQSPSGEKEISLHVSGGRVVISDSGPGVDTDDVGQLFKLFFTRKVRGGRGVGLYLCRANLAAGGHSITYVENAKSLLPGASFAIDFKGAKYE